MAVTWLHVSDFHLNSSSNYNADVVLRALVESVQWFRQTTAWKPDLIFATGDIAGKGDVRVFKGGEEAPATKFFDALLSAAGQGRERLFIVPGNHDVERKKGIGLVRTIETVANEQATQKNIDEYFTQSPMYHLTCKLEAFSSWYNDYFKSIAAPRLFPVNSTCELISCEINGIRLELLHMNSTLFCKDAETDTGKLCIGRSCVNPLIAKLANEKSKRHLALALVHHPFECLHTQCERVKLKQLLKTQIDILLQGHYHQTEVEPGGDLIQLAAGATYLDDGPKRALYGRFDGTKIDVFPICYQEESSPGVWRVDPSVFSDEHSHTKSFFIQNHESVEIPLNDQGIHTENDYATRYHDSLKAELDHLLPPAIQSFSPKVGDVYVSLRLSERREKETSKAKKRSLYQEEQEFLAEKIMSPEKVMLHLKEKDYRILLLVGLPGSGKTTLIHYYALTCLAEDRYKDFGFTEPVLVFYLPLRELKQSDSGYASLQSNIFAWSEAHSLGIPEPFFLDALRDKKTLILLDGLDEISEPEKRKKVCEWIRNTETSFTKATFIVTSRPTGIRKVDKIEISVPHVNAEILEFDAEQQKTFLRNWFKAVFLDETLPSDVKREEWIKRQQAKALKEADDLVAFLAEKQNKSLRQMAGIPLLLQIMAMLWKKDRTLSASRASLYEHALGYLLDYQYDLKKMVPLLSVADALQVLSPVTLWMQETLHSDEIGKEVMKKRIQTGLNKIPQVKNPPVAEKFCDSDLVERAGLLVEYGMQEYIFRHKSFREYLAAFHLVKQVKGDISVRKLVKHFDDSWWEEPIHYFFQQIDEKRFDAFMKHFFDSPQSDDLTQKKQELLQAIVHEAPEDSKKVDALCKKLLDPATTASRQRVILDCLKATGKPAALDALLEFRAKKLAETDDIASRAEEVILALGGEAPASETVTLATGVAESFRNPNEQNAEYILIRKGSYLDSETKEQRDVKTDLYFAKYPVTNKLYRSFIAGIGESKEFRESLDEIAGKSKWDGDFKEYFKRGKNDLAGLFRSSYDEDRKFGGDDQPVVGVSWYAAKAYSLWLSQLEGKAAVYRLPNEREWEWAAGGRQGTTGLKVREYPWSDEKGEPTSKLANYGQNVGATTPVGSYPDGATPEGLYDMAGNVWEWMDNWYDEDEDWRSLRGGSWGNKPENLRCSVRSSYLPDVRVNDIGFRVVRSSHSLSS